MLLDNLVKYGFGNVSAYADARDKARDFLLEYPMKTGYWTDGHTDTDVKSNTYKSNLSASNMTLCLFDYPELDPEWKVNIPKLIKWTEDNFVFRTENNEPSTMWDNLVGEQDSFNFTWTTRPHDMRLNVQDGMQFQVMRPIRRKRTALSTG